MAPRHFYQTQCFSVSRFVCNGDEHYRHLLDDSKESGKLDSLDCGGCGRYRNVFRQRDQVCRSGVFCILFHCGFRIMELDEGIPFVFCKNGVRRGVNIGTYWDFIPAFVRPYFVKKVCFYGPESTGKTTMAKHLAEVHQTEFVPEVSREMIASNAFTEEDIIRIGYAQTQRVREKVKTANRIMFCDTDLITTQIYSQTYLHRVPGILYELERQIKYDQYFLFDIDLQWIDDGLRDLGNQRKEMYDAFKDELVKRNISFINVQGNHEEREQIIKRELNRIMLLP